MLFKRLTFEGLKKPVVGAMDRNNPEMCRYFRKVIKSMNFRSFFILKHNTLIASMPHGVPSRNHKSKGKTYR